MGLYTFTLQLNPTYSIILHPSFSGFYVYHKLITKTFFTYKPLEKYTATQQSLAHQPFK
ncbi:MAG: hypothetical protein ACJAQS_001434 [Porticoccus sp.]|jgi:hypothetical protein